VWTAIKIGTFYGAPVLALLLAIAWFAMLLFRVHRGTVSRKKAAALYPLALLLPLAAVLAIWLVGELAGYFTVPSGQYFWDGAAALQFLVSLLPIAAYVAIPIAVLAAVFWITVAVAKPR